MPKGLYTYGNPIGRKPNHLIRKTCMNTRWRIDVALRLPASERGREGWSDDFTATVWSHRVI